MPADESGLNLVQLFLDRVSRYGDRAALYFKNPAQGGVYTPVTWNQWSSNVRRLAYALKAAGVKHGDRIGILSENRPEWTYVDLAALSLGAVTVPLYPTSSCGELQYYIEDAGIKIFFISTQEQFERTRGTLLASRIEKIVSFDKFSGRDPRVSHLDAFVETGTAAEKSEPGFFADSAAKVRPQDPATIIYTSGTTGPPKGVVLTHSNFIANYLGCKERVFLTDGDLALSFLPLNHVFERLAGYYFMVFHGASIAYAGSMQTVAEDILLVKPTVCAAVPRFYEKVYAGIREKMESAPPLQKKIFEWAGWVGRERYALRQSGKTRFWNRLQYVIAKIFVFSKVKNRLGGRIRFFISGGAPLSKELGEFFYSAGILILEGYGLTETSPVIAVNTEKDFCFGTVGRPLSNVQVKIAEDGEILTKGPCVMSGYFNKPAETADVLKDGWFCTGDIGEFDAQGRLKITDRKKDIIATSGGKKVSPQNIENLLTNDPLFSQCVVVGDKRNYLTALIVPSPHEIAKKAGELGLSNETWEELIRNPSILSWARERLSEKMKDLAPYEQIKYFTFLPKPLSLQAGELTPTLKVKRKVVGEKYKDLIEAMYVPREPK